MNLDKAQKVFKLLEEKGWEIRTGHKLISEDNKENVNNDLNNYQFIACSKNKEIFNAIGIENSTVKSYKYYTDDGSYYGQKLYHFVSGKDEDDIINNLAIYFVSNLAKDLGVSVQVV